MTNPITDWINSQMQPGAKEDEAADKRIAYQSLASQRWVDERRGPNTIAFWNDFVDRRVHVYDHVFVAHADLKHFKVGNVNSAEAAMHYCSLALHRRHQLLQQYPNNNNNAAEQPAAAAASTTTTTS